MKQMMDFIKDKGMEAFLDDLMAIRALYMENNDPDVRVFEFVDEKDILSYVESTFSDGKAVTQMIVPNVKRDEGDLCTHFRIIAENYHYKSPTNYKLDQFLRGVGLSGTASRCTRALVIGLMCPLGSASCNVPAKFEPISVQDISMFEPVEIYTSDLDNILGIPGMFLPVYLPTDVQSLILQYCRSPTADLIVDEFRRIRTYWDEHFEGLFYKTGMW